VADLRFAKPLDTDLIARLMRSHEVVVTVEEGAVGGLGAHVLTYASDTGLTDTGLKVRTMRLPDVFQDHDDPAKQYDEAGLNAPHIVDTVLSVVAPVTPSVPPTVALLVTPTELSVAAPLVDTVLSDVLPITPSVPPTVALPLAVKLAPEPIVTPVPLMVLVLAPLPTLMLVSAVWPPMQVLSAASMVTLPDVSTHSCRKPAGAPGVTTICAMAACVAKKSAAAQTPDTST